MMKPKRQPNNGETMPERYPQCVQRIYLFVGSKYGSRVFFKSCLGPLCGRNHIIPPNHLQHHILSFEGTVGMCHRLANPRGSTKKREAGESQRPDQEAGGWGIPEARPRSGRLGNPRGPTCPMLCETVSISLALKACRSLLCQSCVLERNKWKLLNATTT